MKPPFRGCRARLALLAAAAAIHLAAQTPVHPDSSYLRWDAKRAKDIALSMRQKGQVGKSLDFRVIHTERSFNFKLRATWFTPDVIRARARLVQLKERLSDDETRQLVAEAEQAADVIVLLEIDPREGSGIIPAGWTAFLEPKGPEAGAQASLRGTSNPKLKELKALAGGFTRDYAYDEFWMTFDDAGDRESVRSPASPGMELVVQIHNKTGKVRWKAQH